MDSQLVQEDTQAPGAPRRRRPRSFRVLAIFLLAATGCAIAAWMSTLAFSRPHQSHFVTEAVKRGLLEVKVTERGNLESASNVTLRCLVESGNGTSILKIVDEGKTVAKDQVVVELDSSRLREESLAQQIRVDTADAALKIAEANMEIQKKQNESDLAAAELKLTLARLDLRKYREGDYPQSGTIMQGEIDMAREYLSRAAERLALTERLMRKGFSTTKILDADRVGLKKARIDLAVAAEKKHVVDEYTHRRELTELEVNAVFLDQELVRVRLRAEAALSQRDRNLLAAKRTAMIEHERLDKIERQIAVCTIRAPREGLVVYANDGGRSSSGPRVYEGAVVRERQPIIELPDVADMQVNTRIHESKIAMIEEGRPATIRVDAFAGASFHGFVRQVALVPLSGSWPNPDRKEYAATIKIADEKGHDHELRPGMTAEVEILADRRDAVLQAPVQSCVERGGRFFAWIVEDDDQPQRHEITVGIANDTAIEIIDGLEDGDAVVLNPRSALAREIALLEHEIPPMRETHPAFPHPVPSRSGEPAVTPGDSRDGGSPGAAPRNPDVAASAPVVKIAAGRDPKELLQREVSDSTATFNRLDQNGDAKVTEAELPDPMKPVLSRMDTNGDKAIDRDEWNKGTKAWLQQADARSHTGGGQ